ncbi:MAG: phosphoglucosamine mutase [bacterium]
MEKLIFGISGVRGIFGSSLTEEVGERLGKAFGSFVKNEKGKKIVVGRDLRKSGELVKSSFIKGIISTGCDVIDLGCCATPTLLFNIQALKVDGGAVVTASHNPEEWNGVKFAGSNGCFLNAENVEKVYNFYNKDISESSQTGKIITDSEGTKRHSSAVISKIDKDNISKKHFNIVFDGCRGVLKEEGKLFLESIGCNVIEENPERKLEPLAENLTGLAERVKKEKADAGFAVDPDGDRLSIVNEKGKAIGEEYTLALVGNWLLKKRKGIVVTNLSTSKMIEDIALQNGNTLLRTKVGEINVVEGMKKIGAILGGEGNGGIIDPEIQYTRDAIVGMGRILECLASTGETLSALAETIPEYYMKKDKIIIDDKTSIAQLLSSLPFPKEKENTEDGIRIDFRDGWAHIRKSNTEPIVRIIYEGKSEAIMHKLDEWVAVLKSKNI